MVIRPKADETFEIVYSIQKTESWDMYAQALDKFLARESLPLRNISFPIANPFHPIDDSVTVCRRVPCSRALVES